MRERIRECVCVLRMQKIEEKIMISSSIIDDDDTISIVLVINGTKNLKKNKNTHFKNHLSPSIDPTSP
jgi:hypothetical protein